MKKILILSILFAISFVSCSDTSHNIETQKHENHETGEVTYVARDVTFHVVEIDSCEYLIGDSYGGYHGYGYLSHKGNCKYCAERRKRELQSLK